MAIKQCLAHEDLAEFVESYGVYEVAIPENHVSATGLIGFNPKRARVWIDGTRMDVPILFCAIRDPAQFAFRNDAGPIYFVRIRTGGFDRLLHIDPLDGMGLTVPDPDRHEAIFRLAAAVESNSTDPFAAFDALGEALRGMIANAKPTGLAEQFVTLLRRPGVLPSIAEAAEALGSSVRTLERVCRARYGRSPKRIVLGYRAVETLLRERDEGGRPELHPDFAYADLAHYANDLRKISGLTRTQNFAQMERDRDLPMQRCWPGGRIASDDADLEEWSDEYNRLFSLALERTHGRA